VTLYYLNQRYYFTSNNFFIPVIASLIVFNYFNFRRKAQCFAGDVGSVSIAFIVCFLILSLINATGNFLFVGLLLLYGLDAVTTIIFRIIRKENIFQAHRSHVYQYLANEKKWPHLLVAGIYILVQALINLAVIWMADFYAAESISKLIIFCVTSGVLFVVLRLTVEGRKRLFSQKKTVPGND
jgi:UDP-N-acetylmuramyl pentapeptide phosphotransferase/UDP-N-acetylglucosamine-1-phosphate transferase